mmetsp:Transcript_45707/g.138890  ORF Transcript_45707/g.138890 Transcript_45707/m.138890 type:complete len:200 (-) Transcript_45707:323-922(-)
MQGSFSIDLDSRCTALRGVNEYAHVRDQALERQPPFAAKHGAQHFAYLKDSINIAREVAAVIVHGRDKGRQRPKLPHGIELSRHEARPPVDEATAHAVDKRRLARARVTRDENDLPLRPAGRRRIRRRAVVSPQKFGRFALAAVQVRAVHPKRAVGLAEEVLLRRGEHEPQLLLNFLDRAEAPVRTRTAVAFAVGSQEA